jgi:hypothetical protein
MPPPNPSTSLSAALWGGDGNAGGEATMVRQRGGGELGRLRGGGRGGRVGGDSNGSVDRGRSSRYG